MFPTARTSCRASLDTAVATREEVIRAFEYLSLLRLGPAARNWNHRTIACQLANPSEPGPASARLFSQRLGRSGRVSGLAEAAQTLADVYEKARYAPASDDLPSSALAAARTELCLLAGVSAS